MKKNHLACFFIFLFLTAGIILAAFAQEQLTITTYYPSPYGVYNILRLFPQKTFPTGACANQGEMQYYDGTGGLGTPGVYVCNGTWVPVGGENWWKETSTGSGSIYNTNPNQVVIGATTPDGGPEKLYVYNTVTPAVAVTVAGNSGANSEAIIAQASNTNAGVTVGVEADAANSGGGISRGLSGFAGGSGDNSGVYAFASGSAGSNLGYGVYGLGQDANTNYGLYGQAIGQGVGGIANYGVYGAATGSATAANWAGYFDDGNVYVKNSLGINTTIPRVYPDTKLSIGEGSIFIGIANDILGSDIQGYGYNYLQNNSIFMSQGGGGSSQSVQIQSEPPSIVLKLHTPGFPATNNNVAITSNSIGIGTVSPLTLFHVLGGANPFGGAIAAGTLGLIDGSGGQSRLAIVNGSLESLDFGGAGSKDGGITYNPSIGTMTFIDTNTAQMIVDNTGNATVRNTFVPNGTVPYPSDIRLKKDIKPIDNPLSRLLKLCGVNFYWKKPQEHAMRNGKQTGVIAQEVEKVFPELVGQDSKGYKTVDYVSIVPVLIESIKAQQKDIDGLEEKIKKLEEQLAVLEKKIAGK